MTALSEQNQVSISGNWHLSNGSGVKMRVRVIVVVVGSLVSSFFFSSLSLPGKGPFLISCFSSSSLTFLLDCLPQHHQRALSDRAHSPLPLHTRVRCVNCQPGWVSLCHPLIHLNASQLCPSLSQCDICITTDVRVTVDAILSCGCDDKEFHS